MLALFWFLSQFLTIAHADEDYDCLPTEPVLQAADPMGLWVLPLSWERPEVLTAAQVVVTQLLDPGAPRIRLDFSFPDPKPYGIPYTFQRAELSWNDQSGNHLYPLDWTFNCSGPGRSLFPGGHWTDFIDLSELDAVPDLSQTQLKIWGGRY